MQTIAALPLHAQSPRGTPVQPAADPQADSSAAHIPQRSSPQAGAHHSPGFIDAVGSFFAQSWDDVKAATAPPARKDDPASAADTATASAGKDAFGLIPGLGPGQLVDARTKCGHAANGAPDCHAAVLAVCKGKGFTTGVSVAIESTRNCPVRAWLSGGHSPGPDQCRTDAYVTRAACR